MNIIIFIYSLRPENKVVLAVDTQTNANIKRPAYPYALSRLSLPHSRHAITEPDVCVPKPWRRGRRTPPCR